MLVVFNFNFKELFEVSLVISVEVHELHKFEGVALDCFAKSLGGFVWGGTL